MIESIKNLGRSNPELAMTKHTQETLRFYPVNGKTVRADFNRGALIFDFGTLLFHESSALISSLVNAMQDEQD